MAPAWRISTVGGAALAAAALAATMFTTAPTTARQPSARDRVGHSDGVATEGELSRVPPAVAAAEFFGLGLPPSVPEPPRMGNRGYSTGPHLHFDGQHSRRSGEVIAADFDH